ncbi:MAG: AraC family transcriptional regulator [Defluviitaleaceae bacterium]|nr:AraC family transcriptional regulator [Defluviitaleaceae bacterium]
MSTNILDEILVKASIRFVCFGHDKHTRGDSATFTFQDFDLWFNHLGSAQLEIDGKLFNLEPYEALLMPPGTTLTYRISDEYTEQIYCHFIAQYGDADTIQGNFQPYRIPERHRNLLALYASHIPLLLEDDTYGKIVIMSVLKILLCDMILGNPENQDAFMSSAAFVKLQPLSAVIKYINDHAYEHITIKEVANNFHYNEAYFCSYFKKHIGTSPKQYLAKLKMERARSLLQEGVSVKETAMRVGFSDAFSFSKQFKSFFSLSPTNFKNRS